MEIGLDRSGGLRRAGAGLTTALLALCAGCATHADHPWVGRGVEIQAGGQAPAPPPLSETPPILGSSGGAEGPADHQLRNVVQNIEIVRYIGADRTKWPDGAAPQTFNDLYARLEVESTSESAGSLTPPVTEEGERPGVRSYQLERRSWLARLFANRSISVASVANAQVNDPDVTTVLPLFSISHSSVRGSGEVFVTDFTSAHVQAPLFRIGANTTITVHVNAKISDKLQTDATGLIIKAVQTAVNIAAPTSSVLTTLSKTDVANASHAIDTAIGGLFSQDLTEDIEIGRLMDSWTPSAEVEVQGWVPWGLVRAGGDVPAGGPNPKADMRVGTWHIRLTCPRPSIFDPSDLCAGLDPANLRSDWRKNFGAEATSRLKVDIARRLDPGQILGTRLSSQTTVRAFIQTQSWYTGFTQAATKTPADTRTFCANALNELYGAGLNRFDAALAVNAARQLPGIVNLPAPNSIKTNCQSLVDGELTLDP